MENSRNLSSKRTHSPSNEFATLTTVKSGGSGKSLLDGIKKEKVDVSNDNDETDVSFLKVTIGCNQENISNDYQSPLAADGYQIPEGTLGDVHRDLSDNFGSYQSQTPNIKTEPGTSESINPFPIPNSNEIHQQSELANMTQMYQDLHRPHSPNLSQFNMANGNNHYGGHINDNSMQNMHNIQNPDTHAIHESKQRPKKGSTGRPRGRPKGSKTGEGKGRQKQPAPALKADGTPRKKFDRFNGVPEEEVEKMLLPDRLSHNLDIVIIGINPGLFAAYNGHHYAGPGNHFWKVITLSGLVTEPLGSDDDIILNNYGIGLTTIVARTTRGSADLSKKEIKEGGEILNEKLKFYKPKIAVFNGKGIYEVYSGKKNFMFGKQPDKIEGSDVNIWVMPSSSARCAQLPRAQDKVPFYVALKKYRDYLKGDLDEIDEDEITFSNVVLTNFNLKKVKTEVADTGPENEESNTNNMTFGDLQESQDTFSYNEKNDEEEE